jgi:hypothetical protein
LRTVIEIGVISDCWWSDDPETAVVVVPEPYQAGPTDDRIWIIGKTPGIVLEYSVPFAMPSELPR